MAIGQEIGLVRARDGDGSPEFSHVRYALSESQSSDFATKYFAVDQETGETLRLPLETRNIASFIDNRRHMATFISTK